MKKKKSITKLNELELSYLKEKYPNTPMFALEGTINNKDNTANELEKSICKFLTLSGHQAERIKNMGRVLDNTKIVKDIIGISRTIGSKQYIRGTGTNGTADISATIKGRSVKIEVKIGADKQSEVQKQYEQSIIDSGGQYWIAKDFDMFMFHYDAFIDYISRINQI